MPLCISTTRSTSTTSVNRPSILQRSGSKGVELHLDQNLGGKNDYYYYNNNNNNMSKTSSLSASKPIPLTASALHRKWVTV